MGIKIENRVSEFIRKNRVQCLVEQSNPFSYCKVVVYVPGMEAAFIAKGFSKCNVGAGDQWDPKFGASLAKKRAMKKMRRAVRLYLQGIDAAFESLK